MPLTTKLSVVCDALKTKVDVNAVTLGVKAVYYGDQTKLPTTPVVCVEPDEVSQELNGVPRKTRVIIQAYLLVYHAAVTSPQTNRRQADILAESLVDLIHQDKDLGGLLIHCMVTNVASGYAQREGTLIRTSRITFQGQSQAQLPS